MIAPRSFRAGLGLALLGFAVAAPARPPGQRIVSVNPCIDAILLAVADPAQVAAISHYSQDPRATSMSLAVAARFRATSGTAEEIVALAPDLVLLGPHESPATLAALRRLRIPSLEIGVPDTIAASRDQIRRIATAAGHPARGAALVARIDAAVAAAQTGAAPVPALIWQGGGLVPGTATLADAMLRTAGFHNMSADYGLARWDVLPLEYLVARPPRVLLSATGAGGGDRMLGHPVLKPLARQIMIRDFPERLLRCGGPTIIDALNRLAAVRRTL